MHHDEPASILFVPQLAKAGQRTCGAAALAMVYGSLGLSVAQEEIWREVAQPDARGTRDARTHLLAANALRRGLAAVCLEASGPWAALRAMAAAGVRIVLNLRLRAGSPLGHFSVLVGIGEEAAILHDPAAGPDRRIARGDLLELWKPAEGECESTGHVLVGVGRVERGEAACPECSRPIPGAAACPRCGAGNSLRPAAALGCLHSECPRRLWRRVFCTGCGRAAGEVRAGVAEGSRKQVRSGGPRSPSATPPPGQP